MKLHIKLYGEGGTPLEERIAFGELLNKSLKQILGRQLDDARITIEPLPLTVIPELETGDNNSPKLINLNPEYAYLKVTLEEKGHLTYKHTHSMDELLGKELKERLREKYPNEKIMGYSIFEPTMSIQQLIYQPTPEVSGKTYVSPTNVKRISSYSITKLQEEPLPKTKLSDFNIKDIDNNVFLKVLIHQSVYKYFMEERNFSKDVEEGGFLIGNVFEDEITSGNFIIEITCALDAKHTGASLVHLTYTGDSFAAIKTFIRKERPKERLLGWFHTHLFPATDEVGLSSIDYNLHFSTFRLPWQVAGLVNLDNDSNRTLRFYARQQNKMVLCPQWII